MRWVALVLLALGLFYAGLSGFNGGQRDAARRELRTVRDSLRTARYERDDARDSLREARWAVEQIAKADGWRDSIPPGKWPRYRFAVRAFPDSSDR